MKSLQESFCFFYLFIFLLRSIWNYSGTSKLKLVGLTLRSHCFETINFSKVTQKRGGQITWDVTREFIWVNITKILWFHHRCRSVMAKMIIVKDNGTGNGRVRKAVNASRSWQLMTMLNNKTATMKKNAKIELSWLHTKAMQCLVLARSLMQISQSFSAHTCVEKHTTA